MDNSDPRKTWNAGFSLLLTVPFIGLLLTLTDPPTWVQIAGAALMVALVYAAMSMIRRRQGGWRPSQDLNDANDVTRAPGAPDVKGAQEPTGDER